LITTKTQRHEERFWIFNQVLNSLILN